MRKRPTTLARHLRGFASPSTLQSSHFPSASYSSLPLNAWERGEKPKKRKEQPQKDRGNHLAVIPEIPQADGGGGDDRNNNNNNNNNKNKGSCASCFGCISLCGGNSGRNATAQNQNAETNIGAQAEEVQGVGEYEEESWGIPPEEEQLVEEYEEVAEAGEWVKQEDEQSWENDWSEEAVPLDTSESAEDGAEGEVWHEEPADDRNNENKGNKDDGDGGGDGDGGDGDGLGILDGVGDLISL